MSFVDDPKYRDGTVEDTAWRVVAAQVGRVVGMKPGDDSLSTMVSMHLHVEDLAKAGNFVLAPEHAEALARALLDSAAKARAELP